MQYEITRETLPILFELYQISFKLFDQFAGKVASLALPSVELEPREDGDKAQFRFAFLGSRFLIRHRFGANEDGNAYSLFEILRFDDSEKKFKFVKRCVVSRDGKCVFERKTFNPGIPAHSESVFYELLAGSIPMVDKTP
jgi:hypothetical protein